MGEYLGRAKRNQAVWLTQNHITLKTFDPKTSLSASQILEKKLLIASFLTSAPTHIDHNNQNNTNQKCWASHSIIHSFHYYKDLISPIVYLEKAPSFDLYGAWQANERWCESPWLAYWGHRLTARPVPEASVSVGEDSVLENWQTFFLWKNIAVFNSHITFSN